MHRNFIGVLLFLFLLSSCSESLQKSNVSISGELVEYAGSMLYLEELEPSRVILLDSMKLDEAGFFEFDFNLSDAGFYVLHFTADNNVSLILEKGENLHIRADGKKLSDSITIKGSPGSMQLQDFEKFMDFQRERIDSLAAVYHEARGTDDFFTIKSRLDSIYLTYVEDQRTYIFDFIERNPHSLASLLMINRKLGNTQVIAEKEDYISLYRIDSALQLHYPGNKHMEDHHERVLKIKGEIFDDYVMAEKLHPGKKAPDIVLNDTSGQPVSLKSFTRQKVIIYFWAGWDARSRRDNRRLVKLYPQFKSNNTELLGVSLDENEIVWKGAIGLDQLQWTQLSDLKGIYSPIKKSYHLPDELPYYYLIDESQKIVYKNANLDSLLVHLNEL